MLIILEQKCNFLLPFGNLYQINIQLHLILFIDLILLRKSTVIVIIAKAIIRLEIKKMIALLIAKTFTTINLGY